MAQYELEGLFSASMEGLKGMIDTDTIVGKPIETLDGTTIIPITRLSVGYGVGGWNYDNSKNETSSKNDGITAGSGGGVTVQPVGFLVVSNGDVKLLNVDSTTPLEKICDMLPSALEAISGLVKKDWLKKLWRPVKAFLVKTVTMLQLLNRDL